MHYKINRNTLAIISVNRNTSMIIENNNQITVNMNSTKIIDENCKYFGSSIIGRQSGAKNIANISYKTPIIINEINSIIFFPTNSPRQEKCNWFSLNNIYDYFKKTDKTTIVFNNGHHLETDISLNVLKNQILKSSLIANNIRNRNTMLNYQ